MKLNRIIFALAAGLSLFSVQSCLMSQEDVFPESSSERLQTYLDKCQDILTSAEKGWIMEYYPGKNQAFGGYAYHLTFTGSDVTAVCELDPEKSYKSLYKMTSDNGAVISFDGYNPVLHYFATPSSSEYEAKGGDFEFTITSVSEEKIGLRGKRSGNHYDLYPYTGDMTPAEYMAKVAEMGEGMRAAILDGVIAGIEVTGSVDMNNRRLTFSYKEHPEDAEPVVVTAPYMYTAKGLKTYEPVKVAGATISEMYYYTGNNILTNGSIEFIGRLPENYTNYDDFAGSYRLVMYQGKISYNVTLVQNEDRSGYLMKGMNSHFDVVLGYDKALGALTWGVQSVGANGNNTIWLAAWSLGGGGNLSWNTEAGYGVVISRDLDKNGRFLIEDNGKSELVVDSFILWEANSAGSVGQFTGWGENQFPYLQYLERIN